MAEGAQHGFWDEWLAYYQYWLGAKVQGANEGSGDRELLQHATDQLRHAGMVAGRIIQLGGTPMTEPKKWYDVTSCGYDAPDDPFVKTILDQNIKGERCAIGFYKKLLEATQGKDPVTYNIVLQILQDEVEHEEDLQALSGDLEMMLRK